jgi:hypothetical protein
MIALLLLMIVLGLFALAAARWGVDSREESSDRRRPEYPVGIE